MGVLISRFDDDSEFIDDILKETSSIMRSSEIERKSKKSIEEGFEIEILKTQNERNKEKLKKINKAFFNKNFDFVESISGFDIICENYIDNVDVRIGHRIEIIINLERKKKEEIYYSIYPISEFEYEGFKTYWNGPNQNLFIYENSRSKIWNDLNELKEYELKKEIISKIIKKIKGHI